MTWSFDPGRRMRRGLVAWVGGVLSLTASPAALAAPPPVEAFFRNPVIDSVNMSPSGRHMAMRIAAPDGRIHLAVMATTPPWTPKVIAGFAKADVDGIAWVNDDRLVFATSKRDAAMVDQRWPGLYAINRDGTAQRQLIDHGQFVYAASNIVSRVLPWNWRLLRTLRDGSPDILVRQNVYSNTYELKLVNVSRLNTVTGERRTVTDSQPEGVTRWVFDVRGQPRAVTSVVGPRLLVHWRAGADAAWETIGDFDAYRGEGFTPVVVDADGNLLVIDVANGRDTDAVYRFDVAARKLEEQPLIGLKDFDLDSAGFVFDHANGRLLGVNFRAERPGSYWFDKDLRAVQAGIDRALPEGRTNRLSCGDCSRSTAFVIESSSDTQPGEYYLFDRKAGTLERVATRLSGIDEKSQGTRSFERVKARDGLALPVVVTKPRGAGGPPYPTVVLVHGGPWVRGHDTLWDREAQFLASRGYLVLETEFRGSTGYGARHYRAGFKQWGLAMQDDLADSLAWAVERGLADPKRACIAGGSYGGYAALMGPIRHTGTFRCAISWMGVSDIELMYTNAWSDFSDDWKRYGMPVLIGDRVTDAAQLAATSPLKNVKRFDVPVLLAGGELDRRVPIEHAKRFRDEAQKAGVAVEWIEYPGEGHGWGREANEIDFWRRVEGFLERHIGAGAQAK
jgi:dipeptidyl aminopeptidase/acylaminoacyl peptidase